MTLVNNGGGGQDVCAASGWILMETVGAFCFVIFGTVC